MNMQQKFETVRKIMEKYPNAEFKGGEETIHCKNEGTLHKIRLEIIRAGIDEVYDISYYEPFNVYILGLHLTKGRSW